MSLPQNHCKKRSWIKKGAVDTRIARAAGKGRRLIMLHAITKDGPLHAQAGPPVFCGCSKCGKRCTKKKGGCEHCGAPRDDITGYWEGDTPHQTSSPTTSENLWLANSHTGDYHGAFARPLFILLTYILYLVATPISNVAPLPLRLLSHTPSPLLNLTCRHHRRH